MTSEEIKQIENQGLTIEQIQEQLHYFEKGFPPMKLTAPATLGKGIKLLNDDEVNRMVSVFENALSSGLSTLKFVPASGAASRMFKDLYAFIEKATSIELANQIAKDDAFIKEFFAHLPKFAFYNALSELVTDKSDKREWVEMLLSEKGLGYGQKPKGQLAFHRYNNAVRTPFEEHLFEAASYCAGSNGKAAVHFTVSPEHQEGFERIFESVRKEYQKRLGLQFEVTFSHQKKSTDTIAADEANKPFKDQNRNLVFRPGGHGALLENLADLDADIIFIKNIDNVVPDHLKSETKRYKKALAGILITYRNKINTYIDKLSKAKAEDSAELLHTIETFIQKELCIETNQQFGSNSERILFLSKLLNRPIRVCGMVKNEGEPGGGPFWALNADGTVSLQVVEKAQVDIEDTDQKAIFDQSSHFNPVDLVCSIKNHKGEKFDLLKYRDPQTGFISQKSLDGKVLKALELPGLWNGSMSDWITIFVEVPAITFNPVKTVNDLLRPEHQ